MDCHAHVCAAEQKTKTDAQELDVLVHAEPQFVGLVDLKPMETVKYRGFWVRCDGPLFLLLSYFLVFYLHIRLKLPCGVSFYYLGSRLKSDTWLNLKRRLQFSSTVGQILFSFFF